MKIMGIIVILSMSAVIGFYLGGREKRRISALEALKTALLIIRSEISFSLSTLSESALSAAEKSEKGVKELFYTFYNKLEEKNGRNIDMLWAEALRENVNLIYITTEDIERLVVLGKVFSSIDKNRCISGIDMLIEYIDEKTEILAGEEEKSTKLYPPLCLFGGLMIIIFLI